MNGNIILVFFAFLFLVFSIVVSIGDIKKRKLVGIKKIITILLYLFFGISLSLMSIFININWIISILIFLLLFLICIISLIKNRGLDIISLDLLILIIVGIICCISGLSNVHINKVLWIILGVGIYLMPGLGAFSGRSNIIKKMKRCTKEIDAKIIDVKKGRTSGEYSTLVYIPKMEFVMDGKVYEFMDTSSIYSSSKNTFKIGDSIKLLVNPDNFEVNGPNGCDDVFWPGSLPSKWSNLPVIMFYVFTILIFLFVMFLYSIE
jgi:hypothetical protein